MFHPQEHKWQHSDLCGVRYTDCYYILQSTVLIPLQGKQVAAKKERNGLPLCQESSDYKIILDSSSNKDVAPPAGSRQSYDIGACL